MGKQSVAEYDITRLGVVMRLNTIAKEKCHKWKW